MSDPVDDVLADYNSRVAGVPVEAAGTLTDEQKRAWGRYLGSRARVTPAAPASADSDTRPDPQP